MKKLKINDETENNYFILKNEDEKNVSEKEKMIEIISFKKI